MARNNNNQRNKSNAQACSQSKGATGSSGSNRNANNERSSRNRGNQRTNKRQAGAKDTGKGLVTDNVGNTTVFNDPEWYALNDALMRDSASISYNTAVGSDLPIWNSILKDTNKFGAIPGVMQINYVPGVGYSAANTSAINMAAKNIYSYVRHVNSGHANYEAADQMLYIVAMDSLYSYLMYLRRLYGSMMLYSQYNRYMPRAFVQAMGCDFDDMLGHIVDLRYYINQLQLRVGAFVIPKSIPFFTRHQWMASNIFMDAPTLKAQFYILNPVGFYRYEEYQGAGQCKWEALPENKKFVDLVAYGEKLLGSVVASEDCGIMSGDILKAFGENIFKLDSVPEDYQIVPAYVPEVLNQIQNASVCGLISAKDADITQVVGTGIDAGAILYKPTFVQNSLNTAGSVWNDPRLLTMYKDDPEPADTMVATRLTVFGNFEGTTFTPTSFGSEIVSSITIYRFGYENGTFALGATPGHFMFTVANTAAEYLTWIKYTCWLNCFEHHPAQVLFNSTGTSDKTVYHLATLGLDIDNHTVVDASVVERMHTTAMLSLLKVPVMGSFDDKVTR